MINAAKLLADLKRLRSVLDADLRVAHAAGEQRDILYAEWREAFDLGRTRDTFEVFLDGAFDQSVVHWILGCVFLRFLEDNLLVDRPFLSGPGERLDLAKERQEGHFRARPHDSDAEYLLAIFAEAAQLPGLAGLYDPLHNPLFRLPLSGDGAMALIRFFREVLPETGELTHDFTDSGWGTRFLGDLYQDLSEEARKRYALLQTPEFVEAWILDRTLEPAIREFGHERVTMIDPACGSGHFLLGGFERLLREWRQFAPSLPPAELAQRALDVIAGVDLNPFAVEIARFRLLLAALRASGVQRMISAPGFRLHLAAGDSLLHGRHFFRRELGGTEEGFRRVLRHHYAAEDTEEMERILGRQYHAVVGNPPYITPKDPAMRDAYREIYLSCHRSYGLGAPFTERFFDLAQAATDDQAAGFVGLIVANSFMKREFGKKLIEEVLPRLDLTHIVDCDGAYIPGHGTPTVILFGRNRAPMETRVRTVMGIRGEPGVPADPAHGLRWSAITAQIDIAGSTSEFVSVADVSRSELSRHPWSIGGGGASELKLAIEQNCSRRLVNVCTEIGRTTHTGEDDFFEVSDAKRLPHLTVPMVIGEDVRDYCLQPSVETIFPYDPQTGRVLSDLPAAFFKYSWPYRTSLKLRRDFGQTIEERGLKWYEHNMFFPQRWLRPMSIAFAFVATHNHFVLDKGGKVFNRSAPVIKLAGAASEEDHLHLLGLLNSSTACFWMKSIFYPKGGDHVGQEGARVSQNPWDDRYEFTSLGLEKFPVANSSPLNLTRAMQEVAILLGRTSPKVVCSSGIPTRRNLDDARAQFEVNRGVMISLQEELDWRCYEAYGLLERPPHHPEPPPLSFGERAFEIVLARRMSEGGADTTWFDRHGATPITDIPAHWHESYRTVVERRIALIEQNPSIGLIERPDYKRRWSIEEWEDKQTEALRVWLLNRLERLLSAKADEARLLSISRIADLIRRDADFVSVVDLYVGQRGVTLDTVIAELVEKESVPFLAALRYSDTGLRKLALWEATWEKQRREDAIDAEVASRREEFRARAQEKWRAVDPRTTDDIEHEIERLIADEQSRRKDEEIGALAAPPKYRAADFRTPDLWRLRGGLDVPKERFVSFPHCQTDADGSLVVTWAGHNHLKRALAIAAYYQERKDNEGWPADRLVPLLAGVIELLPWLLQWHNDYDPDLGARMGDYFVDFVQTEARTLGMTEAAVAAWMPPPTPRRSRSRRIAA
jgi:hypothetical protein